MKVDKFGHHVDKMRRLKGVLLECALKCTSNNLNAQHKIVKNLAQPVDSNDCVTKEYVDVLVENLSKKIISINQWITELNTKISNLIEIAETNKVKHEQKERRK